jgi:two-component system, chemotaxis family, CheB/CheR fusion protein
MAPKHKSGKSRTTGGSRSAAPRKPEDGQEGSVGPAMRESPDHPDLACPIVGLGASAGGLVALEEFFSRMPADSGMAFVIVTHRRPGQPSLMPELLGRKTNMPVSEVKTATRVEPDHVYTAPVGRNLAILNGILQPMDADEKMPLRLPIDYFFRSLAQERKEGAIGIILSGTGTDGTRGLKEIKARMGMVMAQQEASAAFAGMPHSAIATGMVDCALPVADMPGQLLAYARNMRGRAGAELVGRDEPLPPEAFQQVFVLLRGHTGHDFSQYKSSTTHRRIERRMIIHHLESVAAYVRFLEDHPAELDVLSRELLIRVTSFFRDPDAFEALGKALLDLLASRRDEHVVRVWVPGCCTGEEAYSIAMSLRECMDRLQRPSSVQIFATDLDAEAIHVARAGVYPLGIAEDVSPGRLERFFVRQGESFRVKQEIREMLVFAPQSLIEDPPFTRLDLLSCRNLLIYLEASLQKRIVPFFHRALEPGGLLFLGSSESIVGFASLFTPIDKKWKIFQRKDIAEGSYVAEFPAASPGPSAPRARPGLAPATRANVPLISEAEKVLLRELVPPTVLVHERGDIVHIHGRTGLFLEPAPGAQPVANIFNMAREGLQLDLAAAIRQAAMHEGEVVHRALRVKTNGDFVSVDLRVRRVSEPEVFRGLFLITFERLGPSKERQDAQGSGAAAKPDRLAAIEGELQYTRDNHQRTIEALESANDELKASNEELQSANEELETSKEEMQSLNEELQTVNAELQGKVEELSWANDDMKNLLNATGIATVFLDNQLDIKRYTEQARRVIRLIPSDVGRPIGDLVSKIRYDRLVEDAGEVLRTLVFKEIEVRGEDNNWYLMRILPYRTAENVIEGLVITFVDVTKIKILQESERRLLEALRNSPTTVFGQDRELRYEWAWRSAFGHSFAELAGKTDEELFAPDEVARLTELKRRVLDSGSGAREQMTLTVDGRHRRYDLYMEPMREGSGDIIGISGVVTDIT